MPNYQIGIVLKTQFKTPLNNVVFFFSLDTLAMVKFGWKKWL